MSAFVVKSLSLAFQVGDAQVIVSRGEAVPDGVEQEVIDRYLRLDAIEVPEVEAEEPVEVPVSELDDDATIEWFKGKKLDAIQEAGLTQGQAALLLAAEAKKANPREQVVEFLEEIATA